MHAVFFQQTGEKSKAEEREKIEWVVQKIYVLDKAQTKYGHTMLECCTKIKIPLSHLTKGQLMI